MNEKEIIKEIMHLKGISQATLAKDAGFKQQSNITGFLNRGTNGLRTDIVTRMLDAMDCELVIRDKSGSGKEWIISTPASE